MKVRKTLLALSITTAAIAASVAQTTPPRTPIAATAATAVPALIPYSGAITSDTKSAEANITFLLYKEEHGGEPLFTESQSVAVDPTGHYKAQLGASIPSGIPVELFATGEARWLEVQVAGERPQPRVLLVSVPYALKAADSATLGGLPASAFALAGTRSTVSPDLAGSPDAVPSSTVTTPGGTTGYLPVFTGAATIADSTLFQDSTGVGIGTATPAATLDVKGGAVVRGSLDIARTGTATASGGTGSHPLVFSAQSYNSSTSSPANPAYDIQAEPTGNNSPNPAATLNLLYSNAETGLYFNPNGTIHFATGQTFPGTGTGNGTITGVTAGTDLTGGGTSGSPTLNLDTTKVPTLAANNTFTGTEKFNGFASFNDGFTANAQSSIYTPSTGLIVHTSSDGSIIAQLDVPTSNNQYGWAIQGDAYNAYSGVYGYGDDKSQAGVLGSGNIGVYAVSDLYGAHQQQTGAPTLTAAVYAQAGSISEQGVNYSGTPAAVFADGGAVNSTNQAQIAVLGIADDNYGGLFINNSRGLATVLVQNNAAGGYPFLAYGAANGFCSIDGGGDLSCSGTLSGSNVTADKRTLATYGVQSAENWYEDYGSGQLHSGVAQVNLDPNFGQTVNTTVDYHVFLTPKGDCKGLYVANETASGFEVHELGGGTTSVAFDYKIVAKRKGYEQVRLADITDKVQKQTEERLKRQAANAHPASHPTIPPIPQRTQLKPVATKPLNLP
jgi:hypothetical protein